MLPKENYLKLAVPVNYKAEWFENLRNVAKHVKWKGEKYNYHITVAFFKDDTHVGELKQAFDQIMHGSAAPELTFDKTDVFQTHSGKEYIIHLTATHRSADFNAFVDKLREAARKTGAELEPGFRLHVTLGSIAVENATFEDLSEVVNSIHVPPFTLALNEAEYRYRPNPKIHRWRLPAKTD